MAKSTSIRSHIMKSPLLVVLMLPLIGLANDSKPYFEIREPILDCENCPPMVEIPSLPSSPNSLLVARHELTWKEYLAAVSEADCSLPTLSKDVEYDIDLGKLADDYPVDRISILEFECYLDWINGKTGEKYRLPTSEEWEHLAKAGIQTNYPWGNELGFNNAAINGQFEDGAFPKKPSYDPRFKRVVSKTLPVESFPPNAWGIYDVVGNVAEFVDERKPGPESCATRKGSKVCKLIAVRGGDTTGIKVYRVGVGWIENKEDRIKRITWTFASTPNLYRGFRLVRNKIDK